MKYNYFVFGNLHGRLPNPFACLFIPRKTHNKISKYKYLATKYGECIRKLLQICNIFRISSGVYSEFTVTCSKIRIDFIANNGTEKYYIQSPHLSSDDDG